MTDFDRDYVDHAIDRDGPSELAKAVAHVLADVADCTANWKAKGYTGTPGADDLLIWADDLISDMLSRLLGMSGEDITKAILETTGPVLHGALLTTAARAADLAASRRSEASAVSS